MSKIHKKLIRAIEKKGTANLGNTTVRTTEVASGTEITICVHGRLLCTFFPEKGRVKVENNFPSYLNVRRINAILDYFCPKGYKVTLHRGGDVTLATPPKHVWPINANHLPSIPTLVY